MGVLVIVALSALAALIFLMSGSTGGFWSGRLTLVSYFENSAGLKIGAPVNLEGYTVGNVTAIKIAPEKKLTPVEVIMKVNRSYNNYIHTDSKSSLETVGVLGDTVVDINSTQATGPPVQNGTVLPTTETPDLQDVIRASQSTVQQLNVILGKVNSIADSLNSNRGSIGKLINDPVLYNKAVTTLNQLQALVDSISNGKGSIGKLVNDDTLYNRANNVVGKLELMATDINAGKGSIGKLLRDDSLYNNLKQSTQKLNDILATVNSGQGSLGMLTKDPKTAARLSDSITRLDSLLTRIDNGEGTIGQLMTNRNLYDHADEIMRNSNQLVTAIRENPRKYLTIRLKIF